MVYYIRCAIAGALVGAFFALMTTPALASSLSILSTKQLPHAWTLKILGVRKPQACMLETEFNSIGSNPRVLPKDQKVSLILVKRWNMSGASFTVWSPFWNFPDGFKAKIVFAWDDENKSYELNGQRWIKDPTSVEAGVNDAFLKDFAQRRQISIMINGEMIGGFPLRGSADGIRELLSCQKLLPTPEAPSSEGWGGTTPTPPTWNGKGGDA